MKPASDELQAALLEVLIREADMDGLVTTIQSEIAATLGCSQTSAGAAIARLAASGKLTVIRSGSSAGGGHAGRHIPAEIQLADQVLA